MQQENKKIILQTLLYADIFDFPLTISEIVSYAITNRSFARNDVMSGMSAEVTKQQGYFCIKGREAIITKRENAREINQKKLQDAQKIAGFLAWIPTIYCIGISGTVAIQNAKEDDDIDFFILTKKNTLWSTRMFCLLFLSIIGKRRTRTTLQTRNTVCLNMFLDETNYAFPKQRQDIYTAHEIIQFVPLFQRKEAYKEFMDANTWVTNFLSNTRSIRRKKQKTIQQKHSLPLLETCMKLFERGANVFQLRLMSPHKTTEIVSKSFAAFHPFDYRSYVIKEFGKRLKKYRI